VCYRCGEWKCRCVCVWRLVNVGDEVRCGDSVTFVWPVPKERSNRRRSLVGPVNGCLWSTWGSSGGWNLAWWYRWRWRYAGMVERTRPRRGAVHWRGHNAVAPGPASTYDILRHQNVPSWWHAALVGRCRRVRKYFWHQTFAGPIPGCDRAVNGQSIS
jgi:hypothetical protein